MIPQATTPVNPSGPVEANITDIYGRGIRCFVHVYRNPDHDNPERATRSFIIESSHPLPSMGALSPYLPVSAQRVIAEHGYQHYNVAAVGTHYFPGVTERHWQDAMITELKNRFMSNPATERVEFNALEGPVFLTLGDALYKLEPQQQLKTSGALAGLRKRIAAEATKTANATIEAAKEQANTIMLDANKALMTARTSLETLKRQGKNIPPAWATTAGLPLRWDGMYWRVGIHISLAFTHLEYKWHTLTRQTPTSAARTIVNWRHWTALPNQAPLNILMWVSINDAAKGIYAMSAIVIDKHCTQLPHNKHDGSCMAPASAPTHITSAEDLVQLRDAIASCLKVVDYTSPLVRATRWSAEVKRFWPTNLLAALIACDTNEDYRPLQTLASDHEGIIDPQQDATETWTAA